MQLGREVLFQAPLEVVLQQLGVRLIIHTLNTTSSRNDQDGISVSFLYLHGRPEVHNHKLFPAIYPSIYELSSHKPNAHVLMHRMRVISLELSCFHLVQD